MGLITDYADDSSTEDADKFLTVDSDGSTKLTPASQIKGYVKADISTGWFADSSWTYASYDSTNKTGVINVGSADTFLSAGMRVKFDQTTTQYGIITVVSSTQITVYFGTDYSLADATISDPYYSTQKAPFDFPLDPTKWTQKYSDSSTQSVSSPTTAVWYNINSASLSVPIGAWNLSYSVNAVGARSSAGNITIDTTLSTTNNSETDADLSSEVTNGTSNLSNLGATTTKGKNLTLTTAKMYYLLTYSNGSGISTMYNQGARGGPTMIKAVCAYL